MDIALNSIAIDCFDYFAIKCAAMSDFSTLISIQLMFLFGLQEFGHRNSFIGLRIKQACGRSADLQLRLTEKMERKSS